MWAHEGEKKSKLSIEESVESRKLLHFPRIFLTNGDVWVQRKRKIRKIECLYRLTSVLINEDIRNSFVDFCHLVQYSNCNPGLSSIENRLQGQNLRIYKQYEVPRGPAKATQDLYRYSYVRQHTELNHGAIEAVHFLKTLPSSLCRSWPAIYSGLLLAVSSKLWNASSFPMKDIFNIAQRDCEKTDT